MVNKIVSKVNTLFVKDNCERCTGAYNALKLLNMLEQDKIQIINLTSPQEEQKRITGMKPILKLPTLHLDGESYTGVELNMFLGSALGCWKWMKDQEIKENTTDIRRRIK